VTENEIRLKAAWGLSNKDPITAEGSGQEDTVPVLSEAFQKIEERRSHRHAGTTVTVDQSRPDPQFVGPVSGFDLVSC
jgi:hypothetical protein